MSGCLYQPCSVEETLKTTERAIMRELRDNANLTQTQMTSLSSYLITLATIRADWHNLTHEEQIAFPPPPGSLLPDSGSLAPVEANLEIYDTMIKQLD